MKQAGINSRLMKGGALLGDMRRLAEPKFRSVVYKNLRSFRLGTTVDGQSVESDGVYRTALESIKGRQEWLAVEGSPTIPAEPKESVLAPLRQRAEAELDLPAGATVCSRTGVTLGQIESDTLAVEAVAGQALRRLMELASPGEKIERVSVARLYPARIGSEAELDEFIARLRERLARILASGGTIVLE